MKLKNFIKTTIISLIIMLSIISLPSKKAYAEVYANSKEELVELINYYALNRYSSVRIIYNFPAGTTPEEGIDYALNNATFDQGILELTIEHISHSTSIYPTYAVSDWQITHRISQEEEEYVKSEVTRILDEIIDDNMDTFLKIKAVHDYIIENAVYDLNSNGSPYIDSTLLTEKKGVCSAYTLLCYRMLTELGIENYIVTGYTKELHTWNLVNLDGEYYHLDVTWDDPPKDKGNLVQYSYFLKSDEQMSLDHTWEKDNYPKATNEDYNWIHEMRNAYTKDNVIYSNYHIKEFAKTITLKSYERQADGTLKEVPVIEEVETDSEVENVESIDDEEVNEKPGFFEHIKNFFKGIKTSFSKIFKLFKK